ncbi:hypothetical protein [Candidatus Deferrimicrobium sp.]|uniref:hypothetical protein n=1 Tax=Candidatus Deferrimicrobium sp. TaxID=3060586 RepID=UPI002719BB7E|nr:hypothetical protein [Candidatus Deferrimicrobium sp.]MDO8739418.1 hypothetical protein [Candidatus Deferrimicrobium sp.]
MKLNKTKLAEFFGVSRSTIGDWGRRGAPIAGGDPSAVARWFVKQRPSGPKLSEERVRLLRAQARVAELELAERTGSMHKTAECRRSAFTLGRQLRDMILIVPDRVDAILAAEDDRARVNSTLRQELSQVLHEFADSPSSPPGRKPAGGRSRKDHGGCSMNDEYKKKETRQ